jgi:hypothetical protein
MNRRSKPIQALTPRSAPSPQLRRVSFTDPFTTSELGLSSRHVTAVQARRDRHHPPLSAHPSPGAQSSVECEIVRRTTDRLTEIPAWANLPVAARVRAVYVHQLG